MYLHVMNVFVCVSLLAFAAEALASDGIDSSDASNRRGSDSGEYGAVLPPLLNGEGKILGGNDVDHTYSWMASLQLQKDDGSSQHWCGGTLIQDNWIVTAAHCQDSFNVVCLGGVELNAHEEFQCFPIARVRVHEKYNSLTYENDIMLVEFEGVYNGTALKLNTDGALDRPDKSADILGWGKTGNLSVANVLQELNVTILDNYDCSVWGGNVPNVLPYSAVCARGIVDKGICTGDSGGPMFATNPDGELVLVGVLSFGADNCAGGDPMVSCRISYHSPWITKTIAMPSVMLPSLDLPQGCTPLDCPMITGTASDGKYVYTLQLTKPSLLKDALYLQADTLVNMDVLGGVPIGQVARVAATPKKWQPLAGHECFPAGTYQLRLRLAQWKTNVYESYKILIRNPDTLTECNPYTELAPLNVSVPPVECTGDRCITFYGQYKAGYPVTVFYISQPRKLRIWAQLDATYNVVLFRNLSVIAYTYGHRSSPIQLAQTLDCNAPGEYSIWIKKPPLAAYGGPFRVWFDNYADYCDNATTSQSPLPIFTRQQGAYVSNESPPLEDTTTGTFNAKVFYRHTSTSHRSAPELFGVLTGTLLCLLTLM